MQFIFQAVDLMHTLVQDRHDADFAVREQFPVDEVLLVAAEIAVDAELGGDCCPRKFSRGDGLKFVEGTADVNLGLRFAPFAASVGIDFVQPVSHTVLDAERGHLRLRAFRLITASASSGR